MSRRKRMKKIIAFVLSLALATSLFAALTSCGSDKTTDKTVKFTWDITEADGEVTLNGYTVSDAAKDLIAKKDYAGLAKGFTANNGGSYDESSVKKVEIPDNVTIIKSNAIDSLSFIEEIVVGDNVKKIEEGAFSNLSALKKITLPFAGSEKGAPDATNGMVGAANAKKLFGYIFGTASTSSLTACTQTYNDGASGNTATYYIPTTLETVVITGEIKVENKELKVNKNDDGKYVLPAEGEEGEYTITVKSYADCAVQPYAFYGVTVIKNVTLKGNDIFAETFHGCTALENVYVKDSTGLTIGKNAFNGCTALKNVTTDEAASFKGVKVIGDSAFSGCTALGKGDEFTIGELNLKDVEKIGELAFGGCTGLVKLVLDASVNLDGKDVKEKAFNGCTGIIEVKLGDKVVVSKDEPMVKGTVLAKIFSGLNDKFYKDAEPETPDTPDTPDAPETPDEPAE